MQAKRTVRFASSALRRIPEESRQTTMADHDFDDEVSKLETVLETRKQRDVTQRNVYVLTHAESCPRLLNIWHIFVCKDN